MIHTGQNSCYTLQNWMISTYNYLKLILHLKILHLYSMLAVEDYFLFNSLNVYQWNTREKTKYGKLTFIPIHCKALHLKWQ